jgi:alkylhydroperoxidase/carboxymuconolactone decarboxylase family protein YurZ
MLTDEQQRLYDAFYASTHDNQFLDTRTELLVGLAAAMALDCQPCMKYYLRLASKNGINEGEIGEVLAKVMAVSAGKKRLLVTEAIKQP